MADALENRGASNVSVIGFPNYFLKTWKCDSLQKQQQKWQEVEILMGPSVNPWGQ